MAKIFVTRQIPGKALEQLRQAHEVNIYAGEGKISRGELLAGVKGVDAILSLLTEKIDEEVFAAAGPNLRIVANYAVGFDNVDLEAAKKHNVMVTNTPSSLVDAVAEMAVTLTMALARLIMPADKYMRGGNYKAWDPSIFLGLDLTGKTLGVVGAGTIGSVVGKRMKAVFEMQVLYSGHHENVEFEQATGGRLVTLEELLKTADVVTLHVPLTPETRHMIGREQLVLMKPTAILINTARGPVVEEKALREALEQKKIWGAALDVYEEEITGEIEKQFNHLDNVILTPHIASATLAAREEMTQMVVESILDVLAGKTPAYLVK